MRLMECIIYLVSVIEQECITMTVFGELHQLGGSTEVDMYKMSVIGHISLS